MVIYVVSIVGSAVTSRMILKNVSINWTDD